VLRKTFGPKRDEETAEWRRLHKEELYDLYSQNIRGIELRRMRWAAHVACTGDRKVASRSSVLVRKPEGQIQLGRPRPRWEDNIKMDHEIG